MPPTDIVRPAATDMAWATAASTNTSPTSCRDRRPPSRPAAASGAIATAPPAEPPAELPEPESLTLRRNAGEEDDEVDMIPLIDISLVLLVFFIMLQAAGACRPSTCRK